MARFNMQTAENYGSNGNSSFFVLKDDGDKAQVRFLYNGMSDIEGYAVHRVALGDTERYVNCLREYNEPLEKCPFCAAQMPITARLFLKLYNEDAKECQIWERSKSYYSTLSGYATRYKPLCNEVIEIERHGKKGDKQTTYQFFPIENSEIDLDDKKYECSEPLGTIILDKTADEMNAYLDTGDFPQGSEQVAQERSPRTQDEGVVRRTPNRRAF
jgi:hypothetical protein